MYGWRKFQALTRRIWGGPLATLEPSCTEITRSAGGVPLKADDDYYYSSYLLIFDISNIKDYPCTRVWAGIRIPVPAPTWLACWRDLDLPACWWRLCMHCHRNPCLCLFFGVDWLQRRGRCSGPAPKLTKGLVSLVSLQRDEYYTKHNTCDKRIEKTNWCLTTTGASE
jgi:hypothetical protein